VPALQAQSLEFKLKSHQKKKKKKERLQGHSNQMKSMDLDQHTDIK
jgi:hypothetical protein